MATVKYYPGLKAVKSLPLWPLRFARSEPGLYEDLTKYGPMFFQNCRPGLHHYDGRTLTESPRGTLLSANGGMRSAISSSRPFRAEDVTSPV